ncbi:hypothetical protein IKF34_01800 [Candidatus Saccharibacteria bacterium]|nr:hypothetical protein [Candidatus Saccharibacteria bacterium]
MKKRKATKFTHPQKIALAAISISMFVVFLSILSSVLFSPERTTKNLLSKLASEYYENYFYAKFIDANPSITTKELEDILGKYQTSGLAAIPLRQLLLYDNQKNAASAPKLEKYCDTNNTYMKFYPEPPYSKTSYRTEYFYSCNFE